MKTSGLQPYQGEPIADPAWIAQYNEERRAEEERRQLLMSRLNGTVPVSNWCTCELCKVDLLVNERGSMLPRNRRLLRSVRDRTCFTRSRYFRSVAYREYIQLVYGNLGKRRIPLPACGYHAIRQAFGGKDFKCFEDDEELE
ncbi:Hypothetical predicted protein [Paramuricea clavata]|uniref:Uncharacterized protein n=1 Tax=Paramuricea clavata TaxID=317549 RepID=A0A7D9I9T5_PARCT|nr:Hypothetical predicted protein [Paramuricea clavata]